ncbi:MAG: hypothetical protein MUC88_14705 [Planctomycetes bacterium]|jgi:hypothetical protein|nr:hypothetical protein [Planctomycetota bacterium]
MNLLLAMILYLAVGCGEWYLALRRTLACARGEKTVLVCIVFIENLLGLWVLSNFIRTNNWLLAVCYSAGASAGALIVALNSPEKSAETVRPARPRSRRRTQRQPRSLVSRVIEHLSHIPSRLPHLSLHRSIGRVEHPG